MSGPALQIMEKQTFVFFFFLPVFWLTLLCNKPQAACLSTCVSGTSDWPGYGRRLDVKIPYVALHVYTKLLFYLMEYHCNYPKCYICQNSAEFVRLQFILKVPLFFFKIACRPSVSPEKDIDENMFSFSMITSI